MTGSSEVAARRLHFGLLCSQALCTALLVSIKKYGERAWRGQFKAKYGERAWRRAGRVPDSRRSQSLVPAVRARARAVRVAAARARRPRIAARPSTAHAGAPGRPDPRPPGPSPAPRRWRLKTPTRRAGPARRGLLKPISPRDVRYSVGSEGASACGSTASRAVCSSSMNSRKALLRAKDSLPSK